MNILEAIERRRLNELANPATEQTTKTCNWCKQVKSVENFHRQKKPKEESGYSYRSYCKQCHAERYQGYSSPSKIKRKQESEERKQELIRQALSRTEKACSICSAIKPLSDFQKKNRSLDGRDGRCKECLNKKQEQKRRAMGVRSQADILAQQKDEKERLRQIAENLGIDTKIFYLSKLGKCGCDYQETGFTLRYCVNQHCVQCSSGYFKNYNSSDNLKYQKWLKSPKVSPTVQDLVEKEARRYFWENRYQLDPEYRQKRLEAYRQKYKENTQQEKDRIRAYKNANPDRRDEQNKRRVERVKRQSDGSVTADWVKRTVNGAEKCPYCLAKMTPDNKTLDHIIPIALGGLHSRLNLVVCCNTCNFRKSDRAFPEWLDMLEVPAKENALRLYVSRYGASPEQGFLPLVFE